MAAASALYTASSLPASVRALNLALPSGSFGYRAVQEAFVTGFRGGHSFTELSLLLLSVGAWVWIHRVVCILLRSQPGLGFSPISRARSVRSFASLAPSFALDFLLLIAPVIWGLTLGAEYVQEVCIAQCVAIVLLVLVHRRVAGYWCVRLPGLSGTAASEALILQRMNQAPKLFLTNYRTSLMIGTSVAILAVDFVVFPRRYCKTESFGIGMMDGGVGSFIISHALTSIHARTPKLGAAAASSTAQRSLFGELLHILRAVGPLVALGVARLFTIKAVDYQEHVSEYGVHWNFFFTLAAVAVLSGVLSRAIHPRTTFFFGLGLLGAYQGALSFGGLSEYILTAPRVDLFSANKEGIFSSIGYFSLYLMAVRAGFEVLAKEERLDAWTRKIAKLAMLDAVLWVATLASSSYVQASSRRMVNLTYGLWMVSLNLLLLLQFMLLELIVCERPSRSSASKLKTDEDEAKNSHSSPHDEPPSSLIIEAINKNSLAFFLLVRGTQRSCNLLTGAVNLSMQTIFASHAVAMAVLLAYALVSCLAIVYVDHRGWTIKL